MSSRHYESTNTFLLTAFNFIYNMKLGQSICLFGDNHSAISFVKSLWSNVHVHVEHSDMSVCYFLQIISMLQGPRSSRTFSHVIRLYLFHIGRRGNCLYSHHRETRPLLGQWNLYKKSYIGIAIYTKILISYSISFSILLCTKHRFLR